MANSTLNSSNTRIRVTPEVLKTRAGDAEERIGQMETALSEILRIVRGTSSYWTGEAADTCRQKYLEEQEQVDEILKRLKAQPKTLLTIANVYESKETEATGASSSLPSDALK
ncbi:MAG: WXG100 family type VII secretion target [Lachnospiraceae bacterium]|nr:WXG100 family type VII secretion target [Lachnospiraceae bacterium]